MLVQILKIKLKGKTYKVPANVDIQTNEKFIQTIRKLYPSTDNRHSLYGKLQFADKLRELGTQINE